MNISGYDDDNYHNGNTFIEGNLFVDGKVYDSGGGTEIPIVNATAHPGLELYAGTNPATGGIIFPVDKNQIIKKHGNWRIISGRVNMTLSIDGFNLFTLAFNIPVGDTIGNINNIYINGGVSVNVGGNSPNFLAQSVTTTLGKLRISFVTTDKAVWPQGVTVDTSAKYCISYITVNSDPANESLNLSSAVENPMVENLDAGNFNISNVDNIQATTFNGGSILTNPLVATLDMTSNTITNAGQINNGGNEIIALLTNDLVLQSTLGKVTIAAPLISIQGNLGMNNNDILSSDTVEMKQLSANAQSVIFVNDTLNLQGTKDVVNALNMSTTYLKTQEIEHTAGIGASIINVRNGLDLKTNDLLDIGSVHTANLRHSTNTANPINIINDLDFQDLTEIKNVKGIGISGNMAFKLDAKVINTLDLAENDITRCRRMGTERMIHPDGAGNSISFDSGIQLVTGVLNGLTTLNITNDLTIKNFSGKTTVESRRREESSNFAVIDTVHIYDVLGLTESTINEGGFDYYVLLPNTTYVIHANITVTQGFKFGINCVLKGMSTAVSITFDESTANIIGFKSTDQNFIIQDLTIIGGGGHFSNSPVGLFSATNINTAGSAPFYGRNKRCLISGCNISAPYSLGFITGFGTVNVLSNFINGGGAVVGGLYTTDGLDVKDGLSFELRGNKIVLFKGAQATSSLKMLNFVTSSGTAPGSIPIGINAVIITGNIFHPRDSEIAISFDSGAVIAVGTISANTFLRTGGTGNIISYPNVSFGNYNAQCIQNFEINGNAGVTDSGPVMAIAYLDTAPVAISSATFTDLQVPITMIAPINNSKRFGIKLVMTGTTGGNYIAGGYIRSVTDPTMTAQVVYSENILGNNIVYITDMSKAFPDALNYESLDTSGALSGAVSTGVTVGNGGNLELVMFDRDDMDLQMSCQISYENSASDKEIQFIMAKDDGAGFVERPYSVISATNPRAGRGDSCTMVHNVRLSYLDIVKLQYKYIDLVDTSIRLITFTGQ